MLWKVASIFFTQFVQIPKFIIGCQFVPSVFGHPVVVNIHDYILLLVVTSLECIVTTNNSNL